MTNVGSNAEARITSGMAGDEAKMTVREWLSAISPGYAQPDNDAKLGQRDCSASTPSSNFAIIKCW